MPVIPRPRPRAAWTGPAAPARPDWPGLQPVLHQLRAGEIDASEAFRRLGEARAPILQPVPGGQAEGSAQAAVADLQRARAQLEALVGLRVVKELVEEVEALASIRRLRREAGLSVQPLVLHMIFKGNPGTGKTTVARLLGRLFHGMEILPKGHLVEVERADLVGEYIGHTAQKTREQVKRALGGILFVDEAYALARGGEKDFGKEAIDTLVKAMEDHREELILILAGYRREMEYFLCVNPGLRSRFPIQIDFPDYAGEELIRIAEHMAREHEYVLAPEARERLAWFLADPAHADAIRTGNARLMRNVIERAIRRQALRLDRAARRSGLRPDRDGLMVLAAPDLEESLVP